MAGLGGLQLQDRLSEMGCKLPIVFISAYGDIPTTVQTIKAGAEDFLTKPVTREKLLGTIERALARDDAALAQEDRMSAIRSLFAHLTPREREVFDLLVGASRISRSHTTWAYRNEPSIAPASTVEKLKARSLAELAVIAERLGLLPADGDKTSHNGSSA